jgi:hypothetical protein
VPMPGTGGRKWSEGGIRAAPDDHQVGGSRNICMKNHDFLFTSLQRFAAEHGGNAVHGGGAPADSLAPESVEVDEALGISTPARGKTPGIGDGGVPGSRTNPVKDSRAPESEDSAPEGRPTGKGSGSGS